MALALPQGQTGSYAIVGALPRSISTSSTSSCSSWRFLGDRRNDGRGAPDG